MWNINKYKNILFGKMIICFWNIIIIFFSDWFIKFKVFQNKKVQFKMEKENPRLKRGGNVDQKASF